MTKLNEKGQGIFEFIIFIPIFIVMFMFIFRVGGAINGSINQQKFARRYFYYKIQNDSTMPTREGGINVTEFDQVSMYFVGWRNKENNQNPVAPCYKLNLPFGNFRNSGSCDEAYEGEETDFIRVQTAYGACGATYLSQGGSAIVIDKALSNSSGLTGLLSCYNK